MQSLLLPAPWLSNTHFGQPRFDIDPGRVSIHPRPSVAGLKSGLRTSNPSFLMSGPPPTGNPAESPRNVQQQASQGWEVTTTSEAADPIVSPTVPVSSSPGGQHVRTTPTQRYFPQDAIHEYQTPAQSSSLVGEVSASQTETAHLPLATSSTTVRTLPPRSTRRAKAHVASACVNCKRKHLGCDSARPCRRCVLAGKAATCVDVTHKKRGRPPLKAEETPLRPYTAVEGSVSQREALQTTPSSRPHAHSRTSSREIRPITDLQFPRPGGYGAGTGSVGMEPVVTHPRRWTTYPSPQMSAPLSVMIPGIQGQRPFSSPVPLPSSGGTHPQTPFITSPGAVFSPPEFRPMPSYTDRPHVVTPPTISPQQYQQPFALSLSPHVQSPRTPTRPAERAATSREAHDPYQEPGLRLPPILPSARAFEQSPPTHRRSGSYPYPTAWTSQRTQVQEQQSQPRLLESPPSLLERLPGQPELRSPFPSVSRPPGLGFEHDRPSPITQLRQGREQSAATAPSGSEARPERWRREESDEGDNNRQPTKRRRMALDDIVND
ncbi:hypothetical protein VTN77DRAFT_408 [Rasamsonia byssochlamydoides]|uniref:uncharacterized protein n=1 Tax=Rasamsonia byssochlamydoides TaxID=89139 RepID=UPI003741FC47